MNWTGKKLKILCEKRSISPTELAERLGVSRQTIYAWFSGREPRGSHLLKLCRLLELDPQELYGDKPVEKTNYPAAARNLFKRSGLKLIYALLSDPMLDADPEKNRLNSPIRDIAKVVGLSTGSVSELLAEMRERGFLLIEGRRRILINRKELLAQWMHGYPEYRFKVERQCFEADSVMWWKNRLPEQEGFLWGGEPAASILSRGYLRPQKLTLYTEQPLHDLVVDANLHQVASGGNVEFVAPMIVSEISVQGCVHPLLVYADLKHSSDDRNMETARRIYDEHLRDIIKSA